ncbi:hypothetical protein [Mycoplasma yeatsii]|uniref:hypothetical protein n=1 Tax=Mycoplasma yeatsii TaxID=51365 RepID=UPI0005B23F14|nr:hypothetical protein [Mycoplasma yeatsii]AJM72099.1 membrane protein [Mycoplasma yeatsii GM274B]
MKLKKILPLISVASLIVPIGYGVWKGELLTTPLFTKRPVPPIDDPKANKEIITERFNGLKNLAEDFINDEKSGLSEEARDWFNHNKDKIEEQISKLTDEQLKDIRVLSDEVLNENILDLAQQPERISELIDKVKNFLDKNNVNIPSDIHLPDNIIDKFYD